MADQDPLLTAAQTAFQALLDTAAEVYKESRAAFSDGLKRQSDLFKKILDKVGSSDKDGGGG